MACRQLALEQQPALRAAQASLAAATDRAAALEKLHSLLARDLPIRRQQSSLGITVASGGVTIAESDTIYGVTYSYLAATYASEQLGVASLAEKNLKAMLDKFEEAAKEDKRKDILNGKKDRPGHRDAIESYRALVRARRQEAEMGRLRALAALREAMGCADDFAIDIPEKLPDVEATVSKDVVRALALARRGELLQAVTVAQITALEADAQASSCLPTLRTFALGSDIHVRPVQTGSYGLEYVPAAVGPEMPAQLAGSKSARVHQAEDYAARADAVAHKARDLILLEADNAYLRWREKSVAAAELERAAARAEAFSTQVSSKFDTQAQGSPYPSLDTVLQAGLTAMKLRVEVVEAKFQALVALAMLERVTAGGVCIDFDARKVNLSGAEPEKTPAD
jgi:outer membrane protein TolC